MALNPLIELEKGNVSFIYHLSDTELNLLAQTLRNIESTATRKQIVSGFLPKLKKSYPSFCLQIIYDMEEYQEEFLDTLKKAKNPNFFDAEKIKNMLYHTTWGKEYLIHNLSKIIKYFNAAPILLFDFLFASFIENQDYLKQLSVHENLKIRGQFMNYLVENHFAKISFFYEDILKYLTSTQKQEMQSNLLMPQEEVSLLAYHFYEKKDFKTFLKLKKFILENYKENDLGECLLKSKSSQLEFLRDINTYFKTSSKYQLYIYEHYTEKLSQKLKEQFYQFLSYFPPAKENQSILEREFTYGLGKTLQKFVSKYLSLSKKSDTKYIGSGTCSTCYQIGDYAFKLCRTKWSYEKDPLCPDLYIIIKNLEECFVRDENGIILAGIEVQKYLTHSVREYSLEIQKQIETFLQEELARLGYYTTDNLLGGNTGDNCLMLDHYEEANTPTLEKIPPFFKKYPAVIVDRDCIYKLKKPF